MSGLFEFLAADENDQRVASRKAVAVASRRCERFNEFLNQSKSEEERIARFAMIEEDFNEVIARTASEYGVDEDHLASSIQSAPIIVTARKPKMCPYHREVVDVSLGTGDPQAGAVAMAQHAYSEQSCRGEYDGKCNFKPEMVSQSYWDTKAEKAQQRREEREQAAKETVQEPQEDQEEVEAPEAPEVPQGPDVPIHEPEEVRSEAPIDNVVDVDFGLNEQLSEAPSAVGEPMSMAASTKEAEALKTVDVDAGSDTPEPKMDKRKWTLDNITWDVDAEMDGSPVPTRHQDIVEPTDYNNDADDGRFDQTDAVLEKQDVSQGEELSHAGQGGTFGNGSQASPVTSASDARPKAV